MRHDLFETDVVAQLNIESSPQLTTLTQMRCAVSIDEIDEILRIPKNSIIFEFFYRPNAAHQRRGEVARVLRFAKRVTL